MSYWTDADSSFKLLSFYSILLDISNYTMKSDCFSKINISDLHLCLDCTDKNLLANYDNWDVPQSYPVRPSSSSLCDCPRRDCDVCSWPEHLGWSKPPAATDWPPPATTSSLQSSTVQVQDLPECCWPSYSCWNPNGRFLLCVCVRL